MKEAAAAPELRPRYGRIAAFGVATLVCGIAFLGGVGVLPDGGRAAQAATSEPRKGAMSLSGTVTGGVTGTETTSRAARSHGRLDRGADRDPEPAPLGSRRLPDVPQDATTSAKDPSAFPLPEDSGEGRRVVFSLDQQRVWLVKKNGTARRTHLASGSVSDNLKPGTYEVYSRSEDATGIDGTTMRWMVRFTRGENAAIGFHDLPLAGGRVVQRLSHLGEPRSHGCIRQAPADARALWRFAPVGTTVVVTK